MLISESMGDDSADVEVYWSHLQGYSAGHSHRELRAPIALESLTCQRSSSNKQIDDHSTTQANSTKTVEDNYWIGILWHIPIFTGQKHCWYMTFSTRLIINHIDTRVCTARIIIHYYNKRGACQLCIYSLTQKGALSAKWYTNHTSTHNWYYVHIRYIQFPHTLTTCDGYTSGQKTTQDNARQQLCDQTTTGV